jgi:D-beta-D-heptose 7-phosphate kinase/D-beta-D-heptose 1-phosphate adenosyltransferase
MLAVILGQLNSHSVVLISDRAKGVCTPWLLAQLMDHANQRGIPVLIDPARIADYRRYRGATLLAPNRAKAQIATGIRIASPEDARAAAGLLSEHLNINLVLIKLDRDGIFLFEAGERGRVFATRRREICDVTGAGAMVLAMMGLCAGSGLSWDYAVQLANLAAGVEVDKLGVVPVTKDEIRLEFAKTLAKPA